MKMFAISLTLLCFFITYGNALSPCVIKCSCENASSHVLGYYWRDYFGTVSRDAFPGGLDEEGFVTFIGQAYIKDFELLPGTIYRGCPTMLTSAYTSDLKPNKNIKILCTNQASKLKWKATRKEQLHTFTNCHLVIGGSEIGWTVYIGRTNYNGETIIGKLFPDESGIGLGIPGTNTRFDEFEVLTYNC